MLNLRFPGQWSRNAKQSRRRGCWTAMLLMTSAGTAGIAAAQDAGERRQLDAHSHDSAQLSLVSEGSLLRVELEAAAVGFLGFEHAPETDEESAAITDLTQRLGKPDALFRLDSNAGCALETVSLDILGGKDHDDGHHDDDHGHDADHDHDHDEEHEHDDDHDHDHDHDHDEEHGDVTARYDFACASIEKLKTVSLTLFDDYPAFTSVEVLVLLADLQSAQTLRPGKPSMTLR